jgi:aminoglycoside phosphotransferase (APT) family kinase protein
VQASEVRRATAAALSVASSLGLAARAAVVLQNSNKLTLRLTPCDTLARVAPAADRIAQFEIDLARRLAAVGSPVAALDPRVEPRVYERAGYAVTLWTYYETAGSPAVAPADYADALARLHAGLRLVDFAAPHFTDRVEQARRLLADRERTPDLADADRALLRTALRAAGAPRRAEQLLHGEPHPGNLLATRDGLVFIDLETCCRGPVEFDLAHAPDEVGDDYPGVDRGLLRECRILMLAMVTTWRWDRDDQLPDGRRLAAEWLARLTGLLGPGVAARPPTAGRGR